MAKITKDEKTYTRDGDTVKIEVITEAELSIDDQWNDFNSLHKQLQQLDGRLVQMKKYLETNQIDKDIENLKVESEKKLKELEDRKASNKVEQDIKEIEKQKADIELWVGKIAASIDKEITEYQKELRTHIAFLKTKNAWDRIPNDALDKKHSSKASIFGEAMGMCSRKSADIMNPIHKELWEGFAEI